MIHVGDQAFPWKEGMTVADVLSLLPDGHLYAVVKLDGRLISRPHFATIPVPDGASVTPIPMIAGG